MLYSCVIYDFWRNLKHEFFPFFFVSPSLRSPTSSLESNNEGSGVNAVQIPDDYPRPRSPNSTKNTGTANVGVNDEPTPMPENESGQGTNGGGGGGGNRQERRRQERKREKSHREGGGGGGEDGNNNHPIFSAHNDATFNHLNKRVNDRNVRTDPMGGSKGVRITQPSGKFMN